MFDAIALAWLERDPLRDGLVTVEIQLDQVLAGLDAKALRDTVEVIDDAGQVAVDVHLCLFRCDLNARTSIRRVSDRGYAPRDGKSGGNDRSSVLPRQW